MSTPHPPSDVDAKPHAEEQRGEADGQVDSGFRGVGVHNGHTRIRQRDKTRVGPLECGGSGVQAEELVTIHVGRIAAADHVGVEPSHRPDRHLHFDGIDVVEEEVGDIQVPTLENIGSRAGLLTRSPRAVGRAVEDGGGNGKARGRHQVQDEREERRIDHQWQQSNENDEAGAGQ